MLDFRGPTNDALAKLAERHVQYYRELRRQSAVSQSQPHSQSHRKSISLSQSQTRRKSIPPPPTSATQPRASTEQQTSLADDGFGDFVDFTSPPASSARFSNGFTSIDLSAPLPLPKPAKPRKEEDLLMLFEDDVEDMGLATASPAKQKSAPADKRKSTSSVSALSSGLSTSSTNSPSPSYDLFSAYFRFLLPFFISLQTQTTSSLIFTSSALVNAPALTRAQLLSTLSRFLADTLAPSHNRTTLSVVRRNLRSASDYYEASLLSQFEKAVDDFNQPKMKEIASTLFQLTGGSSVTQVFINKIPIFYESPAHTNQFDPQKNLTRIDGPDGDIVDGIDFAAMDAFMSHVLGTVKKEGMIIAKVFPKDEDVLVTLAERIAVDVIDDYIIPLLEAAQSLTQPLFLLTAAATFGQCSRLTETIFQIAQEYGHSVKVTKAQLDDVIYRLFEQHMDVYLGEEGKWCRTLLKGICQEWDRKLAEESANLDPQFLASANPQQVKRNVLAGFTKALLLPVTIPLKTVAFSVNAITAGGTMAFNAMTGSVATNAKAVEAATANPYETSGQNGSSASLSFAPPGATTMRERQSSNATTYSGNSGHVTRAQGFQMLLSIETAMQLIQADRDCLKRIQTFSGYTGIVGGQVKRAIEEVFIILCQTLSENHLLPAFVQATDQMSQYIPAHHEADESVTPLVQFFELVHLGDTIAQMIQVYYDRELSKYVDKNDFLSIVVREKKKFENSLDESVASGLNAGVNILMTQAEHILATQQGPRDFCPEADSLQTSNGRRESVHTVMDIEGPTRAAEGVVECLRTHCDMLRGSTDKAILEIFHQEVGLRLHGILLKHFKKSIVSISGGFQVIADLNLYTSFVTNLKLPAVTPYFVALKMAANVFIIDSPKDLGSMARDLDRYEGTLRIEDLMEMVKCRTDWKKIERQVEHEVFGFKAEDCIVQ